MRIGPGKIKKAKENTPPEAQPWPSCIADIIPAPGGEEEVLLGLSQWAAHVPGGHSIFSLIGGLARFWDPFAVQLFRTPSVFELAMDHLQRAYDAYDPSASPGVLIYHSRDRVHTGPLLPALRDGHVSYPKAPRSGVRADVRHRCANRADPAAAKTDAYADGRLSTLVPSRPQTPQMPDGT